MPVPALRSDEQVKPRHINLGDNPLWCPLPAWADRVFATCRHLEIEDLEPSEGRAAGGDVVTLTGSGFPAGAGAGCVFGAREAAAWVAAAETGPGWVACRTPGGAAGASVVVRVGFNGTALSRFGEAFDYVR